MKNIKTILAFFTLTILSSCVNDSFDEPKDNCNAPALIKTKEVQDIYNTATVAPVLQTTDDVIEAVVTSSDEGGNFFKTLSLMSLDGTRGFSVAIDDFNLYSKDLNPGRKVYIKTKDLYTSRTTGGAIGLNIGGPGSGTFNTVSRIPTLEYKKNIIPTCTLIDEETIVKRLTLAQLNNDAYLNALVEVDNVQFESEGTTYGNQSTALLDKNENISDGITTFVTRTSKFANFSGNILPSGKGKIRGVLTKFNGTFQLIIRTERDVSLKGNRVDFAPPIVGNLNTFDATLNEPFTSYAFNQTNFPKYINDAFLGSKYWQLKQFPSGTGNKYIEISSFVSGGGVNAKAYFFVPVDFTTANTFTFKEEMRFYRGDIALRVYYIKSSDYAVGSVVDTTKLTEITSNLSITYPGIGLSENSFNSAGIYSIPPALLGTGYFVFEYIGTPTLTTTVQIDDIVIN